MRTLLRGHSALIYLSLHHRYSVVNQNITLNMESAQGKGCPLGCYFCYFLGQVVKS